MTGFAAGFPNPLVGLAPDGGCALGLGLDQRPQPLRQALATPGLQQHRVQSGTVHIVLALGKGAVAEFAPGVPRRTRRALRAEGLGQVAPTIDAVHDLQGAVLVSARGRLCTA